MIFCRIIGYQLLSLIKPCSIFIIITGFVLQFFMRIEIIKAVSVFSWLKEVILIMYFPLQLPLDLFCILFFLIPILCVSGLFIHKEIESYRIYSLLRMQSYYMWLHATITSLLLFITSYFSVFYLTMFCLVRVFSFEVENQTLYVLNFFIKTNTNMLFIHQFWLLILSVYCMVLFQMLMLILLHNSALSSLITICILAFSIVGGFIFPKFLPFLPFTYGLLAFHEMNDYAFWIAYASSIFMIFFLYCIIFNIFRVKKEEIFMYEKI